MARYSKTLTPAAAVAFLVALSEGALVVAAARAVGVAVSSLYCRRARDPLFAAAWEAAVELSTTARRGRPGPAIRRRNRLAGRRADAFLRQLALNCNTTEAAATAGVHRCTVYRRLRRDPEFARANRGALASGIARLDRELPRRRAAEAARWRARGITPRGTVTQDFDEQMRLLARWERTDGSIGPRTVRYGRMKRWSFEAAIMALARRLEALGLLEREDKDAACG